MNFFYAWKKWKKSWRTSLLLSQWPLLPIPATVTSGTWLGCIGRTPCFAPTSLKKGIADYAISDFDSALRTALSRIPEIVETDKFREELMRFLPKNIVDTTLARNDYSVYLVSERKPLNSLNLLTESSDFGCGESQDAV